MTSISPILIAGFVVVVLGLIGAFVYARRDRQTFVGYKEIAAEVKKVAVLIDGNVFRDGNDLVISGEYKKIPTLVRFSNEEHTPGMSVEVRIASNTHLSISPKSFADPQAGTKVKICQRLDQWFHCRSKNADEIELLMSQRSAPHIFDHLCCSQKTMLEMSPGKLQLAEMVIPESPANHLAGHLMDVQELTTVLDKMPGADAIKIVPIPREQSSWTFRSTVAAGVVIAAICVLAATRDHAAPTVVQAAETETIHGMVRADAVLIPFADDWRVAEPSEFDTIFSDFVSASGHAVNSRIEFDSDGSGQPDAVGYLLMNQSGEKRLVILVDHHPVFDSRFPKLAGITRVSASAFTGVHSDASAAAEGILMVRNAEDPQSAVLFYSQNGALHSGAPADYRKIEVK